MPVVRTSESASVSLLAPISALAAWLEFCSPRFDRDPFQTEGRYLYPLAETTIRFNQAAETQVVRPESIQPLDRLPFHAFLEQMHSLDERAATVMADHAWELYVDGID
jgi:hypothetical protein